MTQGATDTVAKEDRSDAPRRRAASGVNARIAVLEPPVADDASLSEDRSAPSPTDPPATVAPAPAAEPTPNVDMDEAPNEAPAAEGGPRCDDVAGPDVTAVAGAEADDGRVERLAAALELTFRNPALLRLALTHRSVLHDWASAGGVGAPPMQSNERLEFLGDALLGAIAAEYLYERYPDADEGTLTARRVALVRAETLVHWARSFDLGSYLYLGYGEQPSTRTRDRMLAGAFEALVGAVWLDQGMRGATRFLRRFLTREADALLGKEEGANAKGRLQELAQERFGQTPVYRILAAEGPAHARVFTIEVSLGGRVLGVGVGGSKRSSEQAAARSALAALAEGGKDEAGRGSGRRG